NNPHLKHFRLCIERWLEKAYNGNAIFGNLPPFSLTDDINDAPFETSCQNENPWWIRNEYIKPDDDERDSDYFDDSPDYFEDSLRVIGSWPAYDEAHRYFQDGINRDTLFSIKRGKRRLEMEENNQWNQVQRVNGIKNKKIKGFPSFTTGLKRENRIDEKLPSVQGYNDKELKTRNEIRKLNELDNTNNPRWKRCQQNPHLQNFIQKKIENIIKFKKLCEAYQTS
ncbi:unnamed protein product, partial [Rotaria sordida]